MNMLAYSSSIPHATYCVTMTERTIPVGTPFEIYRCATGIAPKYALDTLNFRKDCTLSLLPEANSFSLTYLGEFKISYKEREK